LCKFIAEGIKAGKLPSESAQVLVKLESFCEAVTAECADDGGRSTLDRASPEPCAGSSH
jgi:hypothetical protein